MGFLIFSGFVALCALYLVVSEVRMVRRPTAAAIDYVRRSLSSPRTDSGQCEVVLNHALPLSDHMVKDIAESRGYQFVGTVSRHSNTTLQFQRVGGERTGLSIDE